MNTLKFKCANAITKYFQGRDLDIPYWGQQRRTPQERKKEIHHLQRQANALELATYYMVGKPFKITQPLARGTLD